MPKGPGRPANSLPTAAHLLGVLQKYIKADIINDQETVYTVKEKLVKQVIIDELNKRENMKTYVKKWRTKNAK